MIVVNSLTVTALVCALAKVSATVTATHAPTVSPTVTATNPTAAPTPGPTFPTSVPTSMPTQLQAWTYGDTSSGASCAGTTSDPCGTEYWGNIAGYEMCSTGTAQSPINIASSEPDFELRMPDFHVLHDGCDVRWFD